MSIKVKKEVRKKKNKFLRRVESAGLLFHQVQPLSLGGFAQTCRLLWTVKACPLRSVPSLFSMGHTVSCNPSFPITFLLRCACLIHFMPAAFCSLSCPQQTASVHELAPHMGCLLRMVDRHLCHSKRAPASNAQISCKPSSAMPAPPSPQHSVPSPALTDHTVS